MAAPALFSAALLAGIKLVPAQFNAEVEKTFVFPADSPADSPAVGFGGASGGSDGNESFGRCFAISFGYSEIKNQVAIAESAAAVSSYVCGEEPPSDEMVSEIAEATATAFAIAVTEASVACEGEGDVKFYAKAAANSVAAAEIWLAAYAKAFAEAGDCEKCQAFAESYGYIEQEVFLKAVSSSEATVSGYVDASFPQFFTLARSYNSDIQSATATAFAEAIAGAKSYHEGSQCFAWVNAGGCIWTPTATDPDQCFDCEATSIGATTAIGLDAVAAASVAAVAYTCGNDTMAEADAYVAASAIAEATASAMSFAYATCETGDGAYACSASLVAAEDTARAVAEAFADSWAFGLTCNETCVVESETAARAIGEILVTASTTALIDLCAAEGEQWTVEVLAESIESATLETVAMAIAEAVVGGDECFAASGVFVGTM